MHRYCFNVYFKRQSTCLKSQCHKNYLAIFLQMCSKQNVALHHILTDFQLRGSNNDSAKQTLQKSSSHIFSEIDYCFMTFCSSMSVIVKSELMGKYSLHSLESVAAIHVLIEFLNWNSSFEAAWYFTSTKEKSL